MPGAELRVRQQPRGMHHHGATVARIAAGFTQEWPAQRFGQFRCLRRVRLPRGNIAHHHHTFGGSRSAAQLIEQSIDGQSGD